MIVRSKETLIYSDEDIERCRIQQSSNSSLCYGIDLNRETVPDATILLKFRHLLEEQEHHLTESIFNAINAHLADRVQEFLALFTVFRRILQMNIHNAPD